MTDISNRVPTTDSASPLDDDLECLRAHLHELRAPEHLEGELLAAFKAQQQIAGVRHRLAVGGELHGLSPAGDVCRRRAKRGNQRLAAVLAAGVAVVALVTAVIALQRPLRPAQQPFVASAPAASSSPAESQSAPFASAQPSSASPASSLPSPISTLSFQPLTHATHISPQESYSVVRVRMPITLMSAAGAYELQGSIEADVLLGVDGVASGISFDAATAVLETTGAEQYYDQPIR